MNHCQIERVWALFYATQWFVSKQEYLAQVLQLQFMFCGCKGKKKAETITEGESIDSPLQVRLVKMLGLKNYLLDKFVFRRKPSSYSLGTVEGSPTIFDQDGCKFQPPSFYSATPYLLETTENSIPVVRLKPNYPCIGVLPVIVYSHGNSSDMGDSLSFVSRMTERFQAEYVVFDFTGYGQSRKKEVGEQIIVKDLQILLAWLGCPLDKVILWGFSLGSYPVVINAASFKVAGVILQCPIGSLSCMFYDQYSIDVRFKEDHFANIDHIHRIDSNILMMHSVADEIIPIEQARLLYHKYLSKRGEGMIQFIEVEKIHHNAFQRYISSNVSNDLQKEVLAFLNKIVANMNKKEQEKTQKLEKLRLQEEPQFELIKPPQPQPEELLTLRSSITERKLQESTFIEENYELIETQELSSPKTKISQGWMCCGK